MSGYISCPFEIQFWMFVIIFFNLLEKNVANVSQNFWVSSISGKNTVLVHKPITSRQATYQKINFSLDLFSQFY